MGVVGGLDVVRIAVLAGRDVGHETLRRCWVGAVEQSSRLGRRMLEL